MVNHSCNIGYMLKVCSIPSELLKNSLALTQMISNLLENPFAVKPHFINKFLKKYPKYEEYF